MLQTSAEVNTWRQKIHPAILIVLAGLVFAASGAGSPAQADVVEREKSAQAVAGSFLKELGEALNEQLTKGSPSDAITVCSELALKIANRLSRENGWRVTRVGTRVRNPLIGMPDAWEQQVLAQFQERAMKGESLSEIIYCEVVSEPTGQFFRFMKPIAVQPKCLLCHGVNEQIPKAIRDALKQRYPFDQATGTKLGNCAAQSALSSRLTGQAVESCPTFVN